MGKDSEERKKSKQYYYKKCRDRRSHLVGTFVTVTKKTFDAQFSIVLQAVINVLDSYKELINLGEERYARERGYTTEIIEDLKTANF